MLVVMNKWTKRLIVNAVSQLNVTGIDPTLPLLSGGDNSTKSIHGICQEDDNINGLLSACTL